MSPRPSIVVFGAGGIGRGLVGPLAAKAGFALVFVEPHKPLREALTAPGAYRLRLTGRRPETVEVRGFEVISPDDRERLREAVADASFVATAVGGPHLEAVAQSLAPALSNRDTPVPVLLCENWPNADAEMSRRLFDAGAPAGAFVCVPSSVERMVRAAEGLDLVGESGETLFVDGSKWPGPRPSIADMHFVDRLEPYYKRKLYTNNGGHALLAYGGALRGYDRLVQAMDDPDIRAELARFLAAAGDALYLEYGLDRAALDEHIETLVRYRYPNVELADTVRRVARQPLRKLGPDERLVGLLRVLEKHRLDTAPVYRVIAAALRYRDPEDDEAVRMAEIVEAEGPGPVLTHVCGIQPGEAAWDGVLGAYRALETPVP